MESIKIVFKVIIISTFVATIFAGQLDNYGVELNCQQSNALLALFGRSCKRGPRGEKGIQGIPGPRGEAGKSCSCPNVSDLKRELTVTQENLSAQKTHVVSLEKELDATRRMLFTKDCGDAGRLNGGSGVATIILPGMNRTKDVMCSDGWTVIQRRFNGNVDFYRNWLQYEEGFGSVQGEHWIGLSTIHALTGSGSEKYKLRIELESRENEEAYAEYSSFSVGDAHSNYTLTVGGYSGTAGDDSLAYHNGMKFSTLDRDNDDWANTHCARDLSHGGWWYNACYLSNLNGDYSVVSGNKAVAWHHWKNNRVGLKSTEMMIKRI